MRQTVCRHTSLPLRAPQYQGTDYTEDIKAFWHPFQFGRRQTVSACSGSPPQCSTLSSSFIVVMNTSRNHKCVPQLWGIKREVPASGMKGSRSSVIVITSFGAQLFRSYQWAIFIEYEK